MPAELTLPAALLDYVVQAVQAQLDSGKGWADTRPYNWQVIRALAYLYCEADSPLKGDGRLADAIREVHQAICDRDEPPDNRLTGHLADARDILKKAGSLDLVPGIDEQIARGAEPLAAKLRSYRHITHFTSANQGTSTNHVAVYTCAVHRAGEVLGIDEYLALARATMDGLVADMDPDGYWAETTGGPTTSYNNLTYCCTGRMARWTGEKRYHEAAQCGARFHRRFSYPDGCDLETIDGRVRYKRNPHLWGFFVQSETPQGRAFAARCMETLFQRRPPATMGSHGGEWLSLLCEDHALWVDGPVGGLELDRQHYVEPLRVPGAVRRHGPWFVCLQGITHLPRNYGSFTIDRISLFSLWHEETALIVNGSGEPGETKHLPAQSFRFTPEWDKWPYAVPERAELDMGTPGSDQPARLTAEYRGGTAKMAVHFVSDQELRLEVQACARTDYYPVPFTLQLELRDGDRVNGVTLGEEPVELAESGLQGAIDTERFAIAFPAQGARLVWPHDPYNPYNREHFKSPREKYVSLLTLPLGPEPAQVLFRVR
jgi:hypothetical protein